MYSTVIYSQICVITQTVFGTPCAEQVTGKPQRAPGTES